MVFSEDMANITINEEESKDPKHPFAFEIVTPERTYVFCADSKDEMNEWIAVIKSVCGSDWTTPRHCLEAGCPRHVSLALTTVVWWVVCMWVRVSVCLRVSGMGGGGRS